MAAPFDPAVFDLDTFDAGADQVRLPVAQLAGAGYLAASLPARPLLRQRWLKFRRAG